ncbi:MAG TPA: NlpC/P60 family protein [Anaerolineales bacterium]|nr:NlpC/P60 family protein [Anaerolineales bacterium]
MENIQSTLDMLAAQSDHRTSVFDIEIVRLQNSSLTLSGRLLNESQLESLARHFSNWKLDTGSIRVLRKGNLPRMHVSTNLTGLYDKPTLHMPLSSQLCYGTDVEILDEEGNWVFTRQNDGYLGWVYKAHLGKGFASQATHLVLTPSFELRAQPDTGSEIVTRVVSGAGVTVEEVRGEWAKINVNKTGWIPLSLLRAVRDVPQSIEEKRKTLIEDSARMTGVPYVWGGISGNGIDCSGLSRLLHKWVGMDLPRDADMQHAAARPVEPPFEVGDLLFFREIGKERLVTHVGISLGGWRMVHASQGRNGVYVDDVQEVPALREIFVSAGSFLREV